MAGHKGLVSDHANESGVERQRAMIAVFRKAYPPDEHSAAEVARLTSISDATIRRWWNDEIGLPLRDPVRSSLYRWYDRYSRREEGIRTMGVKEVGTTTYAGVEGRAAQLLRMFEEPDALRRMASRIPAKDLVAAALQTAVDENWSEQEVVELYRAAKALLHDEAE